MPSPAAWGRACKARYIEFDSQWHLMEREELVGLTESGKSIRQIALCTGLSYTAVRYWLRKYGLKTNCNNPWPASKLLCACGEDRPEKFYRSKSGPCGKCHNEYTKAKGRDNKRRAVEFLGGKCERCGYMGPDCAFDFHHKNKGEKDPNFSCMRYWSWERICKELYRCELLCAICHRLVHNEN